MGRLAYNATGGAKGGWSSSTACAACGSLQWVYASEEVANRFNSEAKLGQYLFQGCIKGVLTLLRLP